MTKVIVHDCLPGTGKSTRMIQQINESDPDQKWIVVTPFLKECHRYAGTIIDPTSGVLQLPLRDEEGIIYTGRGCSASGRRFMLPINGYRNKVENIAGLIDRGSDIVTTHTALKLFTPNTIKHVREAGYRLVIDEELECIKQHPIQMYRRNMLLDSGAVYVDDQGLLRWNPDFDVKEDDLTDAGDGSGYSWDRRVRTLCENGSLILVDDDNGDRNLFMWEYPIDFLKAFNQIDVLTYLFDGSVFEKYLKFYKIECCVQHGIQFPENPFELIHLVDSDKMNKEGSKDNAFSANSQRSYKRAGTVATSIRSNLEHFFNNTTYGKSISDQRLWTCLLEASSIFKGRGYTKRFIPHNTKATNEYSNTSQLAYIYNAYLSPEVSKFLSCRGGEFVPCANRYALSELVQWIYRSQVRNNQPINLYVPSSRMRNLLLNWMDSASNTLPINFGK